MQKYTYQEFANAVILQEIAKHHPHLLLLRNLMSDYFERYQALGGDDYKEQFNEAVADFEHKLTYHNLTRERVRKALNTYFSGDNLSNKKRGRIVKVSLLCLQALEQMRSRMNPDYLYLIEEAFRSMEYRCHQLRGRLR
jgi:hypothetical protein